MRLKNLIGHKFGDLKEAEKEMILSSLIFDGSMWGLGRLDNGRYEVTADIAGTDVAIPAVLEVGTDEDIIHVDNNAMFYSYVQGVA